MNSHQSAETSWSAQSQQEALQSITAFNQLIKPDDILKTLAKDQSLLMSFQAESSLWIITLLWIDLIDAPNHCRWRGKLIAHGQVGRVRSSHRRVKRKRISNSGSSKRQQYVNEWQRRMLQIRLKLSSELLLIPSHTLHTSEEGKTKERVDSECQAVTESHHSNI